MCWRRGHRDQHLGMSGWRDAPFGALHVIAIDLCVSLCAFSCWQAAAIAFAVGLTIVIVIVWVICEIVLKTICVAVTHTGLAA